MVSFLIAGVLFGVLRPLCTLIGVWAEMVVSSAVLGAVGGAYLGSFAEEPGRVTRLSAVGFALGGAVCYALGGLGHVCFDGALAGLVGGFAFGFGWRDVKTGLWAGAACALLLPFAFLLNEFAVTQAFGGSLRDAALTDMMLFAPIVILAPVAGFAALGGGLGGLLAYLDSGLPDWKPRDGRPRAPA
jgi:hypothetical protein